MAVFKTKKSRWIAGTIALLVLIIGTLMGTPTGGTTHDTPLNMASITSSADFAAVTPPGLVPQDVLSALLIPRNSTRTGWLNYDQGNGTYDRGINISVNATPSATEAFFTTALSDKAWKTLSKRSLTNGYEILALHSGSDGHFWEIGITITLPSRGSVTPSIGTPSPLGVISSTPVELRLLQYESA